MKNGEEFLPDKTYYSIPIQILFPGKYPEYVTELKQMQLSAHLRTAASSFLDTKWTFIEPVKDINDLTYAINLKNHLICDGFTDVKRVGGRFYRRSESTTNNKSKQFSCYNILWLGALVNIFGKTKYCHSLLKHKQTRLTHPNMCLIFGQYLLLHPDYYPYLISDIDYCYDVLECVRINNFSITIQVGSANNNSTNDGTNSNADDAGDEELGNPLPLLKPDISKAMKIVNPLAKQFNGYLKVIPEETDTPQTLAWLGQKYVFYFCFWC